MDAVATAPPCSSRSGEQRRTLLLGELQEGVLALASTSAWISWLRACRLFRHYSFPNQVLIMRQRPDATWVAGYRTWGRLGRQVRRGERSIQILAPCLVRRQQVGSESDLPTPTLSGFRVVPVFDVAQTEGAALPSPVARVQGALPEESLNRLLGLASRLGFTVEFWELRGERNGDCSHALRRIRLDRHLGPAHTLKTLAHELAHALLHGPDFAGTRALAELEAESVAYVACHEVGVDSSGYSFGYLASWGGGTVAAARAISASGTRIVRAAARMAEAELAEDLRGSAIG